MVFKIFRLTSEREKYLLASLKLYKAASELLSGCPSLSVVNFHQCACQNQLMQQFSESRAAFRTPL
jgi:hypothetical protein